MLETDVRKGWKIFEWNGSVAYFAKGGGKPLGGRARSEDELVRAAKNLEEIGYDVYVHANPSSHRGIKAKAKDITHWRYVVIDLDPIEQPHVLRGPTSAVEAALEFHVGELLGRQKSDVSSLTICETGRGVQAWLAVVPTQVGWGDSSIIRSGLEVERGMVGFLARLAHAWGESHGLVVDVSTSDLSRIVRCPGTKNTKTGREAFIYSIGEPAQVADLIIAMGAEAPEQPTRLDGDLTNLVEVCHHLNYTAQRFLTEGVWKSRRHHDAYATAIALAELGVAKGQVVEWVSLGGRLCQPKLEKSECDYIVKSAFAKVCRS